MNKKNIKYDKALEELNIDETFLKPRKTKIKYENIKQMTYPKEDYNFQADLLFLPTTKEKYKYLLTVVDLWSDEIDAEPLKTKQSPEVLKAFKTIFKRKHLNKPKASIKTDSGKEFKGEVSKYFYDESILHSVSLPGRHRQTGNIENVNKLLGRFLMSYLTNKELELDKEYNEWTDILRPVIDKLNKIRKRPNGNPFQTRKYLDHDLFLNAKFKVGDLVYRKLDIPKNALNNWEKGNVKFRMGDLRYDIKEPKKIKKVLYYPENVRYMINGFPNVSYTENELIGANDEDEKWAVKAIIDKKIQNRQTYYKIWWKGFYKKNATWEPKQKLKEDGLEVLIKEFEKKRKEKT